MPAAAGGFGQERGNLGRLVLLVAIDGENPVVAPPIGEIERVDQALAVAAVFQVAIQNRTRQELCQKCQAEKVRLRKAHYNARRVALKTNRGKQRGHIAAPAGYAMAQPGMCWNE